jgi:hypothetical protein
MSRNTHGCCLHVTMQGRTSGRVRTGYAGVGVARAASWPCATRRWPPGGGLACRLGDGMMLLMGCAAAGERLVVRGESHCAGA